MAELAYTIDEVCSLSKFGRTTIYAAIRDGDLKARKFRRRTVTQPQGRLRAPNVRSSLLACRTLAL